MFLYGLLMAQHEGALNAFARHYRNLDEAERTAFMLTIRSKVGADFGALIAYYIRITETRTASSP